MGMLITDIFERIYVMMKLSLMFWSMTFLGGIILGVGPAFLAITDLYAEFKWDYQEMKWENILKIFKKNFKRGNALFYFFLAIFLFSLYSLFLAVQVQGIVFLIVDFFLVVLMVFAIITYVYSLALNAQFDMTLKNLIKLSAISLFANFLAIFRAAILLVVMGFITNKFKGMILFLTPGMFAIIATWVFKDWMSVVEGRIV